MEAYSSVGRSSGYTEETLNLSMTATIYKIGP